MLTLLLQQTLSAVHGWYAAVPIVLLLAAPLAALNTDFEVLLMLMLLLLVPVLLRLMPTLVLLLTAHLALPFAACPLAHAGFISLCW